MQLPGRRPDERFFLSSAQPFVLLAINLLLVKLTVWGPYPFVSLAFGLVCRQKCKALQLYLGIKCDGTATYQQNAGRPLDRYEFVMVLTPKELAAVRIHGVSKALDWNDQGGV
jgi:hypothetical protein